MNPYQKPPTRPCRQYALWLLGRREWSAKELAGRLKQRGYPETEVTDALEFCKTHGLQSDERYASSRSRSRAANRGNRQILQELATKGVEPELAQEALDALAPEAERAAFALRKFEGKEPSMELSAKMWRHLGSRGFSSDAIKRAVRSFEAEYRESNCGS